MTTTNSAYAVFRDQGRHTCIRVSVDRKYTVYIPFSASELHTKRMTHEEFAATFSEIPDYPPERAAKLYLFADGVSVPATGEARQHLARLAGEPFIRPDLRNEPAPNIPPSTPQKDSTMATANTEAPTKRKPAAPPPAAKKAEAAPAKKPAAKKAEAAPAKKATKKVEVAPAGDGTRGRSPNFGGDSKIKVLAKENPKRAAAAERFALYKNGMTVDEYLAAGGKRADVNWDVKQGFIEVK